MVAVSNCLRLLPIISRPAVARASILPAAAPALLTIPVTVSFWFERTASTFIPKSLALLVTSFKLF